MFIKNLPLHTRLTAVTTISLIGAMIAAALVLLISIQQGEVSASGYAEELSNFRSNEAKLHEYTLAQRERSTLLAKTLSVQLDMVFEEVESIAQRIGGDQILGAFLLTRQGTSSAGLRFPRSGPHAQTLAQALTARTRPEGSADLILITNREGQPIAINGEAQPPRSEAPAHLAEAISSALLGRVTTGLFKDNGVYFWLRSEPLRAPDGRIAGSVVAGMDLQKARNLMSPWRQLSGEDVEALLLLPDGSKVNLGNLSLTLDADPSKAQMKTLGVNQIAKDDLILISNTTELLKGEMRTFVRIALQRDIPNESPILASNQTGLRGVLSLIVITIATMLLMSLILRHNVSAISALATRMRLVSLGHLGVPITPPKNGKEIKDVAESAERMRVSLAALMDRHPTRHHWS